MLSGLAAGMLAAQSLAAQDTTQARTHTVVRGDNLWDLSQTYLGNPFLWPEIYRLNRDVVEDPHWIYPGEVLRLPGPEGQIAQAPGAPAAPTTPEAPAQPGAVPVGGLETTVFGKMQPPGETSPTIIAGGTIDVAPPPTVRPGEVMSAPYVDRIGGPRGFGRILKSGDIAGVAAASDRSSFQAYDRVFISPPAGEVAPEGVRYLTYRLGPVLENLGQVIIPTGIVEVWRAARSDVAAMAKVVKAFQELRLTDRLIPLDTAGISSTVRPLRVVGGPSTTVKWVYGEPVMPSVQSFVVLGVSSREGVRMGDEFLIYLPRRREDAGPDDPEIPISKAQVVRSTAFGVTAVVVGQEQPAIKEGMAARVVARMP
jgi:hypothetical protein